jgi:hypothetical protein
MTLRYLDFDDSGDADGHDSFDAMAAVGPDQLAQLEAEVVRVLDWAEREFGPASPLDEGGEWDYELQGVREFATPLQVRYVPAAARLDVHDEGQGTTRVTLTLTISGAAPFCAAFRRAFAVA